MINVFIRNLKKLNLVTRQRLIFTLLTDGGVIFDDYDALSFQRGDQGVVVCGVLAVHTGPGARGGGADCSDQVGGAGLARGEHQAGPLSSYIMIRINKSLRMTQYLSIVDGFKEFWRHGEKSTSTCWGGVMNRQ